MYVRPSTSVIVAPCAELMKRGVPPTPRNARTGEFTPPGINSCALMNSFSDFVVILLILIILEILSNSLQEITRLTGFTRLQPRNGLLRFHRDRAKTRHADQSRCGALWLRQELAFGVVNDDFRIFTRLTEATGELCGFDDRSLRNLFSRWVTYDDVRTGIVAGVHPEIVRLGHAK